MTDTANLSAWLFRTLGDETVVTSLQRLKGGAIQENWLVETIVGGDPRGFVIRKDAPAVIDASLTRRNEFLLLRRAHAAGVTVPEPVAFCDDPEVFGGPFALVARVPGVGLGPRVVKDLSLAADRPGLTRRLGAELARIHAIRPPDAWLAFLGEPPEDFARAEVRLLRSWLDRMEARRPALEWLLRWCERTIPASGATTLIHRDFRTGNYMVDGQGLTAVLDWEFACWGDPMFDIGWFCAECWRFSRPDLEAGGIGARADFCDAYEAAGGLRIDPAAVAAYEVLAHARWATIALQQGERHLSGREPSLEHALTGRMAAELELGGLRLLNALEARHG
jgi:aminoglycoside phosphotransferase (APT) family kinase protein